METNSTNLNEGTIVNSYIIAAVTDDVAISQHFGRAKYYEVVFVEDGKVVKKEQRDKLGHHNFCKTRTS